MLLNISYQNYYHILLIAPLNGIFIFVSSWKNLGNLLLPIGIRTIINTLQGRKSQGNALVQLFQGNIKVLSANANCLII